MKKYISYLNSISVAPDQHERTMKRLHQKLFPSKKPRIIYRYVGLAVCALILLFFVWTIVGLFTTPIVNTPTIHPTIASTPIVSPTIINTPIVSPPNNTVSAKIPVQSPELLREWFIDESRH